MEINDPRITSYIVDGQVLYIPNEEAWEELMIFPHFGEVEIPVQDLIFDKVRRNLRFEEIKSALGFAFGNLMFYELLKLDGIEILELNIEWIRVFIENVICEHCKKPAGFSATSGDCESYMGCEDRWLTMRQGLDFPVLPCPHCSKPLQRRHTIWLANEISSRLG
jgi:hypothetical protein